MDNFLKRLNLAPGELFPIVLSCVFVIAGIVGFTLLAMKLAYS